ncbi:MAG: hypothetical protein A2W80_13165 [Candidatus Riflebacteria bacterium GWC2_50_8]|nr:MAG: hypothetical protein A2W80_13165 [Candidatus Riflebacteria bacterium GWC2_50_8]
MTRIKRGSVVLVEVVFSSGFGAKLRPALVISTSEYNKNRGEVIVSGITSNTKQLHDGDTVISEWEKAGLKVPSLATAILQTVKKDRIQKCLGQIDELDFARIEKNISAVIGFSIADKK